MSRILFFVVCAHLITTGLLDAPREAMQYVGCFQDKPWPFRILNGKNHTFPYVLFGNNHPDKCGEFCRSNGYAFAGLENIYDCHCGNVEPKSPLSDSKCNFLCWFANALPCGGALTTSVYRSGITPKGEKVLMIQTRPQLAYAGCYKNFIHTLNSTNSTSLFEPGKQPTDEENKPLLTTPAHCARVCGNAGFSVTAVTRGSDCLCSNDLTNAEPAKESDCMKPCLGNEFIRCGGVDTVAVYNKTGPQI